MLHYLLDLKKQRELQNYPQKKAGKGGKKLTKA